VDGVRPRFSSAFRTALPRAQDALEDAVAQAVILAKMLAAGEGNAGRRVLVRRTS
jgi:hypothetical protein